MCYTLGSILVMAEVQVYQVVVSLALAVVAGTATPSAHPQEVPAAGSFPWPLGVLAGLLTVLLLALVLKLVVPAMGQGEDGEL
ncbi:MAG: hypothetical protein KatS3mg102_2414 [Planctomycetota bacterium]|nr:MAG: hypothetical protein KatS3mg102_2414 [Planctomycetota bacterium]